MPARLTDPARQRPPREWYSMQRWRIRARHQLAKDPLCCLCIEEGEKVTPATVADHYPAHGGDYNLFLRGPIRSLCKAHHDALSGFVHKPYSSAIGGDGLPIDPAHPFNKKRDH